MVNLMNFVTCVAVLKSKKKVGGKCPAYSANLAENSSDFHFSSDLEHPWTFFSEHSRFRTLSSPVADTPLPLQLFVLRSLWRALRASDSRSIASPPPAWEFMLLSQRLTMLEKHKCGNNMAKCHMTLTCAVHCSSKGCSRSWPPPPPPPLQHMFLLRHGCWKKWDIKSLTPLWFHSAFCWRQKVVKAAVSKPLDFKSAGYQDVC